MNKGSSSKSIYLFYGEDDFSLRKKVDHWKSEFAKKYAATSIYTLDGSELSERELIEQLNAILSPSLFSAKKLVIAKDCLPAKAAQTELMEAFSRIIKTIPGDYFLVLWQTSRPDRRLGFIKKFMEQVNVMEFTLPHGLELNQWIKKKAGEMGVAITDKAADKFAQFMGRDLFEEKKAGGKVIERKEAFDLWEVHSELAKLACFTNSIQEADVERLVQAKVPDNVFKLTDELVNKNKKGALKVLEDLLAGEYADEKSAIIKIVGLLSEQIRSFVLVSKLQSENMSNDRIAKELGWTPGRVFITDKNMRKLSANKLNQLLDRLLAIDIKLKSSDENPKLLIDLFLAEATS